MISETLHNAVAQHQAGRIEEASRLYEEILRIDPNHPDALHLSGVIDWQRGRYDQAEQRIRRAIAANPGVPSYYSNLGAVYRTLGDLDKAVGNCRHAIEISTNYADAHNNLGNALADQGKFDEAVASYRYALQIDPERLKTLNNLGNALRRTGDVEEAEACYRRAVELQPRFSKALVNLADVLESRQKYDEAEVYYRRVLEVDPHVAMALNGLGNLMLYRGQRDEAEAWYRKALEADPNFVPALNNLGNMLSDRNCLDEAEDLYRRALRINPQKTLCYNGLGSVFQRRHMPEEALSYYRRAVEIDPSYTDALSNLAAMLEKLNRMEEAAPFIEECLRLDPDHPAANLWAAVCQRREGRLQEGIERLERLHLPETACSDVTKSIRFELAKLHDRAGNTHKAFHNFTEANRLALQIEGPPAVRMKQRYLRILSSFRDTFTKQWVESWSPTPPLDQAQTPVFLIGFPRSGTTLMRVVLDSHPEIGTAEEKPTIISLEQEAQRLPGHYPKVLADLSPAKIESLRAVYFAELDKHVDRQPGKVIVDKYPLNLAAVGLILRVFPKAKFIVAIRHPCDCCLSCFMQNFEINQAMASFFTLEDTAHLYDTVMRLWRQYTEILPHNYHILKYEDLVEDFDGQTRRLLQFLGVPWDDSIRQYAEDAKKKGWIHTPSYQQVVEPIYRTARYRWQRYAEHLQPIMPLLDPHIESFGYRSSNPPPIVVAPNSSLPSYSPSS